MLTKRNALGAAIAILAVVAPGPPAGAASPSACTTNAGVTVIVDFTHFGRDIERGCASGHPASALAALRAAGFATAGTAQYGDAFLCRVDGLPSSSETCAATPPAKSSWSFYYARPTDSTWTYGAVAVVSYQPPVGTIVAFAFGNLAKPGIGPSAAIPAPPTTTAPTTAPPRPTATPTSPPVTAQIIIPTTATTRPSAASTPPVPSRPSAVPHVVDRTATGPVAKTDSGSPLPAVLTVLLVALLGLGAGVTIRRRGRAA